MKVVIAIDSFKDSISSIDGSRAISEGIREVDPDAEIVMLPLADGGEGTVDAVVQATGGQVIEKEVTGPLHNRVQAKYGVTEDGKTAIIEVAQACGLPLVPDYEKNPLKTTTYGVGELILDAIEKGCRHFVIGLGGSATNDAGVGMLQALGVQFLDQNGEEVELGGQALEKIESIESNNIDSRVDDCVFQVACDVNNPLYGENGAAYIFGPQKGATENQVVALDKGLKHFADVVKRDLNMDIYSKPGSGAAGGLGAAFSGFLKGELESGIHLTLDLIKMEEYLEGCDLVITGEGMLDGQTSMGKVPVGVAKIAQKHNVPVVALAGGINQENFQLNELGISGCFSVVQAPMSLKEAMKRDVTYKNLKFTTRQVIQTIRHFVQK
ncbi:glycerate kinase [Piscibacillus halophilus]|uniref:glycerate kinase n=1 Tax=Piscibacillus halophilus TaxID=571933 RepID=UPI00158F3E80|nr:glycerate kinase [Piscibacillus halophilus]